MPDCDYCDASFGSEGAYHDHLRSEHLDELGPIDKRRVGAVDDGGDGLPTGPIALGVVILAAAAIVAYVVLFAGGSGGGGDTINGIAVAQTPTSQPGSVHYHGTINMTVAGQQVDFTREEYKRFQQYGAFHFEGQNDPRWHVHATGVTLQYGMATLGINVTDSTVTFDGTTYRDADEGTTVVVQVNGNDVDPAEYTLQDGDSVRILVRQS